MKLLLFYLNFFFVMSKTTSMGKSKNDEAMFFNQVCGLTRNMISLSCYDYRLLIKDIFLRTLPLDGASTLH